MTLFKSRRANPKVDRVLLGVGLALLAAFTGVVVWLYFGEWGLITDSLVVLFVLFSCIALVQRWRNKIRLAFGVRGGGVVREVLLGFGICALAWTGIFLFEWALGAIHIEEVRADVGALAKTLGIMSAYGAYEEVMFRVLILCGMIALFRRPWLAVGLSSVMFGLVHLNNPDATALGLASNTLGGVMYGVAFVRTGRVWMPVGLHTAWNWMQGPVFGFNVSGASEWSDKLIHQVAVGPELITGGVYGESSVVVIAFRFVVIALVVLATRSAYLRSAHPTRLPATSKGSATEAGDLPPPPVRRPRLNSTGP